MNLMVIPDAYIIDDVSTPISTPSKPEENSIYLPTIGDYEAEEHPGYQSPCPKKQEESVIIIDL